MQITAQAAVEYVKAHFVKFDEPVAIEIVRTEENGEVEPGEAIDVFFRLPNTAVPEMTERFTVWIERYPNVAPFIYGEW